MKLIIKVIVTVVFIHSIAGLTAQNTKEKIQNANQIKEGQRNLERDINELKEVKIRINKFEKAFDRKDLKIMNAIKIDLMKDFKREVSQSEAKAVKARKEIKQSNAEIRSENREIRRNREDSKRYSKHDKADDKRDMARDKRDRRDDIRDKNDDIRDFEEQIERALAQKNILTQLMDFTFGFDDSIYEKSIAKKRLISQFVDTMHEDIAATKREIEEDRREMQEDRRETRDDKRERNETDNKIKRRYKN